MPLFYLTIYLFILHALMPDIVVTDNDVLKTTTWPKPLLKRKKIKQFKNFDPTRPYPPNLPWFWPVT